MEPDLRPGVLVVEDDPAVLEMLKLGLEAEGFEVTAFTDPFAALMWASDAEPICIVADFRLPGIEDLDLIESFQAMGRHSVVLVSAVIDVRTAVRAMKMGVQDVVQKPVPLDGLIRALRTATADLPDLAAIPETGVFTRREREVGELLVAGRTTKEIAQHMGISPRTVDFFRTSLMRKTHSPNSVALAAALARLGY